MRDKDAFVERAETLAIGMEDRGVPIEEIDELANIYMNLGATMTAWALVNAGIINYDEIEDLEFMIQEVMNEVSEGD
jgi:hypothetical protein